jgi:protein-S-isoprenylcysteine O-methyltransferase Ste14
MRIIFAVIASACSISILIDSPRRELAAQLGRDWQEYREHVGNPAFPATSENLSDSFQIRLDTKR